VGQEGKNFPPFLCCLTTFPSPPLITDCVGPSIWNTKAVYNAFSRLTPAMVRSSESVAGEGSSHVTVDPEDEEKSDRLSEETEKHFSGEFNASAEQSPRTQRILASQRLSHTEFLNEEDVATDTRKVFHGAHSFPHTGFVDLEERISDSVFVARGSEASLSCAPHTFLAVRSTLS
jgi:hypothetical protein